MCKDFFSTNEAAQYLGLSAATVRYHLYQTKNLTGQKLGNSLMFTRDQLDEFKAANFDISGGRLTSITANLPEMQAMRKNGATLLQIAETFGCDESYVSRLLNKG